MLTALRVFSGMRCGRGLNPPDVAARCQPGPRALLRPWLADFVRQRIPWINLVDKLTILMLVYTSFCDSFRQGVWSGHGAGQLLLLAGVCAVLFAVLGEEKAKEFFRSS